MVILPCPRHAGSRHPPFLNAIIHHTPPAPAISIAPSLSSHSTLPRPIRSPTSAASDQLLSSSINRPRLLSPVRAKRHPRERGETRGSQETHQITKGARSNINRPSRAAQATLPPSSNSIVPLHSISFRRPGHLFAHSILSKPDTGLFERQYSCFSRPGTLGWICSSAPRTQSGIARPRRHWP